MPRIARRSQEPGSLEPGSFYHVWNRGVARADIFDSDLDRVVFLSILAALCLLLGARCHAFCLMTNHFHLLLEDPRGLLSQLMHRLESAYAAYFNRSRSRRGHLFQGRFGHRVLSSPEGYERLARYVLTNPLRARAPLAATAEAYAWSSAALHVSERADAPAFCAGLLERAGGLEAALSALPRASRREYAERRRARLEALAGGAWLEADAVRCGRTGEQYRAALEGARAMSAQEIEAAEEPGERAPAPGAGPSSDGMPRRAEAYAGVTLAEAREAVLGAAARLVPVWGGKQESVRAAREVACYWLWRLTSAGRGRIGRALRMTGDEAARAIERVRSKRAREHGWDALLWRGEWHLRWRLLAAPIRG